MKSKGRISVNVEETKLNQHYQLRSTITQKEQPVLLSPILLEPPTIKLGQRGLKAARGKLSTSYEIAQPFSSFSWHKMLTFAYVMIANIDFVSLNFGFFIFEIGNMTLAVPEIVDANQKLVTCVQTAYH